MILTVATLALTLATQQPVDKPTLELYQERFVVRSGSEVVRVPISTQTLPPPAVMFRNDDTYAVWDERGLTVRDGDWIFTTRLAELPVSPKLRSRQEILETLDLVRRGNRKLEADSISGMRRLGSKAYVLARWTGSNGQPWLEALVSIDLTAPRPKPKLEGQFAGLSLARAPIDEVLSLGDGRLVVPINTPEEWGLGYFDPALVAFSFTPMGHRLLSYSAAKDRTITVESTSYGTVAAAHWKSGERTLIFEGRGQLRFVDDQSPELLVGSNEGGRYVYWAGSGAERRLAANEEVRRAGKYVLTWSPPSEPTRADLYDPDRWDLISTWRKPSR